MLQRTALWKLVALALAAGAWNAFAGELSLDAELTSAGVRVERFWHELSRVSCTETVQQWKIDPEKDKVLNERRAVYDYIVFLQWFGDELAVEESRELREEQRKKKLRRPSHRPLLVTNGFAMFQLVFHPRYQTSYVFEEAGEEALNGLRYRKIAFEHVRGAKTPSALRLEDRLYPIAWSGEAWISEETGQPVRLKAWLQEPLEELGLQRLDVDVEYGPIDNEKSEEGVWMPRSARVEAATERQLWRNEHRFSDYRRFQVETDFQIGDPDLK